MKKLKLKKLHEVLAMYPDYEFGLEFFQLEPSVSIDFQMIKFFGTEIEVEEVESPSFHKYHYKLGKWAFCESWFEPVLEKERWHIVTSFSKEEKRPFQSRSLYESKEDFLSTNHLSKSDFHWIKLVPFNLEEG